MAREFFASFLHIQEKRLRKEEATSERTRNKKKTVDIRQYMASQKSDVKSTRTRVHVRVAQTLY